MQLAAAHGFGVLTVLIVFQGLPLYVVDELDLPAWVPGVLLLAVNTAILASGQSTRTAVCGRVAADAGLRALRGDLGGGGGVIRGRRDRAGDDRDSVSVAGDGHGQRRRSVPLPLNGSVPVAFAPEALRGEIPGAVLIGLDCGRDRLADHGLGSALDKRRAALGGDGGGGRPDRGNRPLRRTHNRPGNPAITRVNWKSRSRGVEESRRRKDEEARLLEFTSVVAWLRTHLASPDRKGRQ